jgi:acetylornithine deacetylase
MDSVELVSLTRNLVDIDSTTGREGDAGRWLADYLRGRGYSVREQPVDGGGRANVLATIDAPRVVFSTHFDCVPPFFPSRVEGDKVFGRGACDAKGILAAQVGAVERLRVTGVRDVGLLFVVGEERGSDGATLANELAKEYTDTLGNGQPRYLINGEPTENRLGAATRGVWRVKLTASGRAAHTSRPELGESAIEKLLDALVQMRGLPLPKDEALGKTYYTVGLIDGGVAPNVVPPHAEAEVMFRTVGPREEIRAALAPLERLVAMEDVLIVPTVRLKTVPGFETEVFPYTTDIPFLSAWGQPLLYGPGSILHAHTAEEHVRIADLERAVLDNEQIARQLLAGA